MLISLHLVQCKCTKMNKQEIPSIGRNILEFFRVSLNTDHSSNLYEKFQAVSTYDTHVEYQM